MSRTQPSTRTFNITAPAANGIYNAYFHGFNNDTCTSNGEQHQPPHDDQRRRRRRADLRRQHHLHRRQPRDWNALTTSPSYADVTRDAGGGSGDITRDPRYGGQRQPLRPLGRDAHRNRNQVASDGFSITVDADRNGTSGPPRLGHVQLVGRRDRPGRATVRATFTTVGSAQQTCNFVACSQRQPRSRSRHRSR